MIYEKLAVIRWNKVEGTILPSYQITSVGPAWRINNITTFRIYSISIIVKLSEILRI